MNLWTELHTALLVGRTGTVRAASDHLQIHRATVSRHIDTLEEHLGIKLFLRHKNGYTPTQKGLALIRAAEQADLAISGFLGFLSDSETHLTGSLTVSALARAGDVIRPAMKLFCERHPGVKVCFNPTVEIPKLELGEAHVLVHAGAKPDHPDYVVIPYFRFPIGLFAHDEYLATFGTPKSLCELSKHRFVGSKTVYEKYGVQDHYGDFISDANTVLESNSPTIVFDGIRSGIGLGFAAKGEAEQYLDLKEVLPPQTPIMAQVWITTHVDMHRTRKVSEFVGCLKEVKTEIDMNRARSQEVSGGFDRAPICPADGSESQQHPVS